MSHLSSSLSLQQYASRRTVSNRARQRMHSTALCHDTTRRFVIAPSEGQPTYTMIYITAQLCRSTTHVSRLLAHHPRCIMRSGRLGTPRIPVSSRGQLYKTMLLRQAGDFATYSRWNTPTPVSPPFSAAAAFGKFVLAVASGLYVHSRAIFVSTIRSARVGHSSSPSACTSSSATHGGTRRDRFPITRLREKLRCSFKKVTKLLPFSFFFFLRFFFFSF